MSDTVKKVAIAFLILLILVSSFVYYNNYVTKSHVDAADFVLERRDIPIKIQDETPIASKSTIIKVHVAGAVNDPGLYEAIEGSRVADLIFLAGGGTTDADLDKINLAAIVNDGQQVFVPSVSDIINGDAYINNANNVDNAGNTNNITGIKVGMGLININTASVGDLKSLPGIGDVLSQAIIDYRDRNGGFRTVEDIKNVSGIGEKRFDQIKELITVK